MKKVCLLFCSLFAAMTLSAQSMYGWLLGTQDDTLLPGIYGFDFETVDAEFSKVATAYYQIWGGAGANDDRYYFLMSETMSGDEMGLYVYDFAGDKRITQIAATNYGCADLTYDATTGWMYGLLCLENGISTEAFLGVVNLQDGTFTKTALLSTPIASLAADSKGNLYGIADDGILYAIDKQTGACAKMSDTKFSPSTSYQQSLEFDRSTGSLYWSVIADDADAASLLKLNAETGQSEVTKTPASGTLFVGLWVPFTGGVLPGEGAAPTPYVDPNGEAESSLLPVPYSVDFSAAESPNWTAVDANEDGNTWMYDLRKEGRGYCMTTIYFEADDYFVSNPFELKTGMTYRVSYTVKACDFFTSENFALTMGQGKTAADQTVVLDEHRNYTSSNPTGGFLTEVPDTFTVEVTVPEDGQYSFALHCTSVIDSYELEFHGFSIEGKPDGMSGIVAPSSFRSYYQLNPQVRVYRDGRKELHITGF